MGGRRQLFIAALIVILGSVGLLGYSYTQQQSSAHYFHESGYILTGDPALEMKQLLFTGGTTWRNGLDETVSFDDVQGNKAEVSSKSFVHYDTEDLAALSDGVVVDLNDISSARMTNHYAVSSKIVFASAGPQGYTPSNTSSDLQLTDFLWKVSENKYMIVSDDISLYFAEDDLRNASHYIEVTYIDDGVIQLQTEENLWFTVSNECRATLDNGEVIDLSMRNIQDENGNVLMDFGKILLDSEGYTELIPLTEELKNVHESVIPHFDITARPGENGESGVSGSNGAAGSSGEEGEEGEEGDVGENGEAGQMGETGLIGISGEDGAAGSNGSAGASGSNGAAGAAGTNGVNGNPGSSEIRSTVLNFPVFNLQATATNPVAWSVSATGCSGTIVVTDAGQMIQDSPLGTVSLYKTSTGQKIDSPTTFSFGQLAPEGYPFSFSGLEPDSSYRLVATAWITVETEDGSNTYRLTRYPNRRPQL